MNIDEISFIHTAAVILGNVKIGHGSSVWPGAVLRGDYNDITIGNYTSIQDNSVMHCSPFYPSSIGDWVTVGHAATIHGAVVEDYVVVGMRSVLLDGVKIGSGTFIAAGTMVPEGTEIPPDSFVSGSPAQIIPARPGTREKNKLGALTYYLLSRRYLKGIDTFPFKELVLEIKEWGENNPGG